MLWYLATSTAGRLAQGTTPFPQKRAMRRCRQCDPLQQNVVLQCDPLLQNVVLQTVQFSAITGQYGATFSHQISPWSCMVLELYLVAKHNTSILK